MTEAGRIFGSGLAFPPRLGPDGRMLLSEGSQNIRESIKVILLTELRERLMRPEFGGGLRMFLFEPNVVATHRLIEERTRRALERWEPRIKVEDVRASPDREDDDAAVLTIEYRLTATGDADTAVLSVQLGG